MKRRRVVEPESVRDVDFLLARPALQMLVAQLAAWHNDPKLPKPRLHDLTEEQVEAVSRQALRQSKRPLVKKRSQGR